MSTPAPPIPPGSVDPPILPGNRVMTNADKVARAISLRRAGMEWEDIAPRAGYRSRSAAYTAVKRHLDKQIHEGVDDLRRIESQRLDALQLAAWPAALRGDTDAIRTVVKIMERRSRLLGLDVPVEFTLRLESEQVEFMEGTMRRFIDGVAAALTAAGHGDVVDDAWDVVSGEVLARELTGLAAAADPPAAR